jgi:spore photoproduct lyase family protein
METAPDHGRVAVGHANPRAMLDLRRIYIEPAAEMHPRGQEILARFPEAERVPVRSHWQIPELHGDANLADHWNSVKRTTLVLGVRRSMASRPNGRSADFVGPGASNGCAMACAYCYVARRKGFANPITVFVNNDQILAFLARHARKQGRKPEPNQVDPELWVYDVGENGDCSVGALISDDVRETVALFRTLPNAKASFATKYVNPDLLGYDPRGKTRVRFSLMPEGPARLLDVRTSPVRERIAAIDEFCRAGYEVHVNFSPVVVQGGWLDNWRDLFRQLDTALSPATKGQLAAEVIMLTHNEELHQTNLAWHPKAEAVLWRPDLQEVKASENGACNLRYRFGLKRRYRDELLALLAHELPYCRVRYAF